MEEQNKPLDDETGKEIEQDINYYEYSSPHEDISTALSVLGNLSETDLPMTAHNFGRDISDSIKRIRRNSISIIDMQLKNIRKQIIEENKEKDAGH